MLFTVQEWQPWVKVFCSVCSVPLMCHLWQEHFQLSTCHAPDTPSCWPWESTGGATCQRFHSAASEYLYSWSSPQQCFQSGQYLVDWPKSLLWTLLIHHCCKFFSQINLQIFSKCYTVLFEQFQRQENEHFFTQECDFNLLEVIFELCKVPGSQCSHMSSHMYGTQWLPKFLDGYLVHMTFL